MNGLLRCSCTSCWSRNRERRSRPAELAEALQKNATAAGLLSSWPRDQRAHKCRWIRRSQVVDTRRARAVQLVFELHQQERLAKALQMPAFKLLMTQQETTGKEDEE